jgi:hypothetical protein
MSVATTPEATGYPEDYEVQGIVWIDARTLPQTAAATRPASRLFDRFQLAVLPFAAIAAIAAPTRSREVRRVWSGGNRSRTQSIDIQWWPDGWTYTTEPASLAEVQALNRLLALPAAEGLVLDSPDE